MLCPRCGKSKPPRCSSYCKRCFAAYMRSYRKEHGENRETKNAYERRWRKDNRERCNAKRRLKRWRNRETQAKAQRRRLVWLLKGNVTVEQLRAIYKRDQGRCIYCGKRVQARFNPIYLRGFDHTLSRANGGKHEAGNLTICCKGCNALKG